MLLSMQLFLKILSEMANCVDSDQTAPSREVCFCYVIGPVRCSTLGEREALVALMESLFEATVSARTVSVFR